MLIDTYTPVTFEVGCCPNKIYCNIFDNQGNALQLNTGVYGLEEFTLVTQNLFAILLVEDTERTKYYKKIIDNSIINLPDTPDGEWYTMEFWYSPSGSPFSRTLDQLFEARRFQWVNKKFLDARISDGQMNSLEGINIRASFGYDSDLKSFKILAWLDRGNVRDQTVSQCTVILKDHLGATLMSTTRSTYPAGMPGVFCWDFPNLDLPPDTTLFAEITIVDAEDASHTSDTSIITWD